MLHLETSKMWWSEYESRWEASSASSSDFHFAYRPGSALMSSVSGLAFRLWNCITSMSARSVTVTRSSGQLCSLANCLGMSFRYGMPGPASRVLVLVLVPGLGLALGLGEASTEGFLQLATISNRRRTRRISIDGTRSRSVW